MVTQTLYGKTREHILVMTSNLIGAVSMFDSDSNGFGLGSHPGCIDLSNRSLQELCSLLTTGKVLVKPFIKLSICISIFGCYFNV